MRQRYDVIFIVAGLVLIGAVAAYMLTSRQDAALNEAPVRIESSDEANAPEDVSDTPPSAVGDIDTP
jgi:hypothetical protein